jgi:hypothetical protein
MDHRQEKQTKAMPPGELDQYLRELQCALIAAHYSELATQAAHKQWSHVDYLGRLIEGEAHLRRDRATQNRVRQARFPVIKTLDQFRWDWPTQITRLQVQGSSPCLRPSAKARHTKPKCAFAYCVHFADHTLSAGSA